MEKTYTGGRVEEWAFDVDDPAKMLDFTDEELSDFCDEVDAEVVFGLDIGKVVIYCFIGDDPSITARAAEKRFGFVLS